MGGIQSKRQNHITHDGIQSKNLQPYKQNHHIPNPNPNPNDLAVGIQSKRLQPYKANHHHHHHIHLPHDLIQIILFRLPVKSLLRFTAVCKQWKATISDYRFAVTHLRQSKSSSNRLFATSRLKRLKDTSLVEIEDGELRVLSAVYDNIPQQEWFHKIVLCHCDGLYLVPDSWRRRIYILFNPSNRTFKILLYPYPHYRDERRFGIFYDPLVRDYKVVIGDRMHYAIFHCKTESWGSIKKMNDNNVSSSVFNPSFYWVFNYKFNGEGNPSDWKVEVLGFDGRDGKFRRVKIPELISSMAMTLGGRLCLFPSGDQSTNSVKNYGIPMNIIGEVGDGDEWMKVHLTCSWFCLTPLCWTYRNEIIIYETKKCSILYYDVAERRLRRVRNRSNLKRSFSLVPYVENMFRL